MADDLLTTLLVARTGPVLAAPAMNDAMYANPATVHNLRTLSHRGWDFVGPEIGALAEGPSERPGRMSEPERILIEAERVLARGGPWHGRRVLVTAGPTREHLDAVRVVTNPSSGRMGYALAAAAYGRGAEVTLVSGPTALEPPEGVPLHRVETTAELDQCVRALVPQADALFMAAAPADYRPGAPADGKQPRGAGALRVTLEPTTDILGSLDRPPRCVGVGFALETGNGLERARRKLREKHLDFIVVNDTLEPGAGFEVPTNRVTILAADGREPLALPLLSKREVAERILDVVGPALR
jgi:phosphopantothenoylcysteine decarboxylase/phosphopantothenate--cysteine ligase